MIMIIITIGISVVINIDGFVNRFLIKILL